MLVLGVVAKIAAPMNGLLCFRLSAFALNMRKGNRLPIQLNGS